MIDWGTGLQVAVRVANRESATLRAAYRHFWVHACGRPKKIASDQEKGIIRKDLRGWGERGGHGARTSRGGERLPEREDGGRRA
eukprot:27329-Alexandrium_andersonii.AAC.1